VGEIGFVAPFRYTSLIWALLLGWMVFGDFPAPLTMLGAAIVVASGLFTFWRERQLANEQIRRALVFADLAQRNGARPADHGAMKITCVSTAVQRHQLDP
jgi:hypothetical protein